MAAPAAAEHILKTGEVSAMLKLGFLPSPTSSPSNLSPMFSPPPPPPSSRLHPSPPPTPIPTSPNITLFDIIAEDDHRHYKNPKPFPSSSTNDQRRARLQERVSAILLSGGYLSYGAGDVELSVSSADGFRVFMSVHRKVLARRSRFFAEKLVVARRRRRGDGEGSRHVVEICECDDVDVYVEAVALMYCEDLGRRLSGEGVGKVLSLLKVSAAITFDEGVMACIQHLEAVPWSEEEEENVVAALGHLQLYRPVSEVLQRVSVDPPSPSGAAGIVSRLISAVLQSKDEKARREMKALVSKLFREDGVCGNGEERETLYNLCHKCLGSLSICLFDAARVEESRGDRGVLMGEISREADNLQWMVEILISKRIGEEFVMLWANQKELAMLHAKIPCVYRYEISRITAQLCVAIGRGQLLVSKQARFSMLQAWLEALYDDFGWMKRACRSVDRKVVEDGLSQTILTLPMAQQQMILLNWFERFLNKGDDCPNIHGAFEVWWRRAFVRQHPGDQDVSHLQIAVCDYPS